MPRQAELNGHDTGQATVSEVTSHFSGLAYDLITLTELQARLMYIDVRETSKRSAGSAVFLASMLVFCICSIPIVLLGLSELLVEFAGWHRAWAYLVVGGAAGAAATAAGIVAAQRLRKVGSVFARSHEELQENLEFVKSLVRGPESDEATR